MGWSSNWPPQSGDDIQGWDFLSEPFRAMRDVVSILTGNYDWPPGAMGWGAGTVVSVTQPDSTSTDLLVDCGNVDWSPLPSCSSPRYVNMTCPDCYRSFIPANYDLVFPTPDMDDPWQTVRGAITAQDWAGTAGDDGQFTIDGTAVLNAITGGFIPSLDALAGRAWQIIKQGADPYPTPPDRMPYKPNELEEWVGTSCMGGIITIALGDDDPDSPPTYGYLQDTSKPVAHWDTDRWTASTESSSVGSEDVTYELLAFDTSGLLHRVVILHNDADTIYFEQPDPEWWATGPYTIVKQGSKGIPGRAGWRPYRWYSGLAQQMYGHDVDDRVGLSPQPTATVNFDEGDPCDPPSDGSPACQTSAAIALDGDIVIPWDDLCETGRAGEVLVRDYWSTWRSLQTALPGLAENFVPRDADRPYTFTPALLFYECNINAGASSLAFDGTSVWSFEADPDYVGFAVYWTVMRNGMPYQSGTGNVGTDGTVLADGSFTTSHGDGSTQDSDIGLEVRYSAGWTRFYPEWFQYPVDRTCFVPDYRVALDGAVTVIDPPVVALAIDADGGTLDYYDCNGRGSWQTRPKSTGPVQGPATFEVDHYYRLVGDNFNDPGIVPHMTPSNYSTALVPYWNHFYRGRLSGKNQAQWNASKAGTIASGNARSITAEGADWWTDWCDGSFVETQTARISTVTPYVPANPHAMPPTPEVPGHTTVSVSPPVSPSTASWTVTDDTDGSGTGATVLTGTVGFSSTGTQDVTLSGEFTNGMANTAAVGDPSNGYTVTFVFHGALHVESGTATAGTSTTLTDGSKDTTDNTQPWGCWWANAAFQGSPAYINFILEIVKAGDDDESSSSSSGTVYKTPITSTSSGSGGVVLTFAALDGLTVEAGDSYAIREPAYTVNRWRGCQLTITDPSGTTYSAPITNSDADTLYYDPIEGLTVPDDWTGWKFSIDELIYGGVYQWDGTKMVSTAGMTDDVRLGVPSDPQDFLPNITCNLEGFKRGYGPIAKGDVITLPLLGEIYYVLNALEDTLQGVNWTSRADPAVCEANKAEATTNADAIGPQYSWGPLAPAGSTSTDDSGNTCTFNYPSANLMGGISDAQTDTSALFYAAHLQAINGTGESPCTGFATEVCVCASGHGTQDGVCGVHELNSGLPYKAASIGVEERGQPDGNWVGDVYDSAASAQYMYAVATVRVDGVKSASSVKFFNYATYQVKDQYSTFTTSTSCEGSTCVYSCVGSGELHFDSSGDPVQYNDWTYWGSGAPDGSGRVVSPRLGSINLIDLPQIVLDCTRPTGEYWVFSNYGQAGYNVTGGTAVVKWSKVYDGPWVMPSGSVE